VPMFLRIWLLMVCSTSLSFGAESVRVIVLFKDRVHSLAGSRSKGDYARVRRALEMNARESQKKFFTDLKSVAGFNEVSNSKSLWIANAAIVDLPRARLAFLKTHPDVAQVFLNSKMTLIRDFPGRVQAAEGSVAPKFSYGLNLMGLPELWKKYPKNDGRGIRIGLLDSGVDAKHPDLAGKVIDFKDFTDPLGRRVPPYDDNGHGTHVAGTLVGGAASGMRIGVAPGAKLVVAKVFSDIGTATIDDLLLGMQWIADPDGNPETLDAPSVVSNSWGGDSPNAGGSSTKDVFCRAVASWVKLGIFPVFAAGNSGPRPETIKLPAGCPGAFAVGATDETDTIAEFSSRGSAEWKDGTWIKPNATAPGVDIFSAVPGGTYRSASGTSMATPHVAGLLALLYQATPGMSVNEAFDLVGRTAHDLGAPGNDDTYGLGRVDAARAMDERVETLRTRRRSF
jgi:subtilisin family serine protease